MNTSSSSRVYGAVQMANACRRVRDRLSAMQKAGSLRDALLTGLTPSDRALADAAIQTVIEAFGAGSTKRFRAHSGLLDAWSLCERYVAANLSHEAIDLISWLQQTGSADDITYDCESMLLKAHIGYSVYTACSLDTSRFDTRELIEVRNKILWACDPRQAARVQRLAVVSTTLFRDPADLYSQLDFESTQAYRRRVEYLAGKWAVTPLVIAETAVQLACLGADRNASHVGTYLFGPGAADTAVRLGTKGTDDERQVAKVVSHASLAVMFCAVVTGAAVAAATAYDLDVSFAWTSLLALLLFEGALSLADMATSSIHGRRPALLIDYSASGLPGGSRVALVVPTLLVSKDQVDRLVECAVWNIRQANDSHVTCILLSDFPDSHERFETDDERLLMAHLVAAVDKANGALGSRFQSPIQIAHRDRTHNDRDGVWWGRHRKPGKLHDLADYLCGNQAAFSYISPGLGPSRLGLKYILCLDEDSRITTNTVQLLAGFLDHPQNTPAIVGNRVVSGHAIAVCGSFTDATSARSWRFPATFVGNTLNPLREAPVSASPYFDFFGEAGYSGKGMFNPLTYRAVCGSLPYDFILSHDNMEAGLMRPGYVGSAGIVDRFPSTFASLFDRNERWLRGDLQNVIAVVSQIFGSGPMGKAPRYPALGVYTVLLRVAPWIGSAAIFPLIMLSVCNTRPAICLAIVMGSMTAAPTLRMIRYLWRDAKHGEVRKAFRNVVAFARNLGGAILNRIVLAPLSCLQFFVTLSVVARRQVSKRNLLAWRTASQSDGRSTHWRWPWLVASILGGGALYVFAPARWGVVQLSLLVAWLLIPFIGFIHNRVGK